MLEKALSSAVIPGKDLRRIRLPQHSYAYLSLAMMASVSESGSVAGRPSVVYGGVSAKLVSAPKLSMEELADTLLPLYCHVIHSGSR